MWWYVEKISDDGNTVVYSYGFESREQTGMISYERKNQLTSCRTLATGDTEKGVNRLFQHIYRIVESEGCPDQKMIAIG